MRVCKIFVISPLLHGKPQFERIAFVLETEDLRPAGPCCVAARAECLTYLL